MFSSVICHNIVQICTLVHFYKSVCIQITVVEITTTLFFYWGMRTCIYMYFNTSQKLSSVLYKTKVHRKWIEIFLFCYLYLGNTKYTVNGMTSIFCIHNENEYKIEFNQNGKQYDLLLIKKMLSFKRIDLIRVNFIRI